MRLPLEALEIVSGSFLNVTMNNCLQRELDQRLSIKLSSFCHLVPGKKLGNRLSNLVFEAQKEILRYR